MHYNCESEKGGDFRPFRVVGRKSIHSHNNCPFNSNSDMGGYGLKRDKNCCSQGKAIAPSCQDSVVRGYDEVDNVMSKPLKTFLQVNQQRRNSLSPKKNVLTSESDDSDYAFEWPDTDTSIRHWNGSILSNDHRNSLNSNSSVLDSSNSSHKSLPTVIQKVKHTEHAKLSFKDRRWSNQLLLMIVIVFLSVGGYYVNTQNMSNTENSNTIRYDKINFNNDLDELGNKYKINDDEILMIQTGISTVIENKDTGSFIFVYNSAVNNFEPNKFDEFVDDISSVAAKYLRNDTPSRHISIDSSQLDMDSHGEFIQKYREDVVRTGLMLVKEMDRVPAGLAMAFHYYCDEYNPLVKKSAIFFTLDLAKCPHNSDQKLNHARIENCLMKKWNGVPKDNVRPLLSRVISIVIDVTNVF